MATSLGVRLVSLGDTIQIEGDEEPVQRAERAFQQLRQQLRHQNQLSPEDVRSILDIVQQGGERVSPQNLTVQNLGRFVRPRTDGQARYIQAMRESDVTLCVGPAGCGAVRVR